MTVQKDFVFYVLATARKKLSKGHNGPLINNADYLQREYDFWMQTYGIIDRISKAILHSQADTISQKLSSFNTDTVESYFIFYLRVVSLLLSRIIFRS